VSVQRTSRAHPGERGDIISRWLLQMLAIMAVISLVAYEVIALGLTTLSADDAAREVARAARDAYRVEQSLDRAEATAQEAARSHDATLVAVDEDGDVLSVTVEKRAQTLLVHRIGPLSDVANRPATSRVRVR
jgi:hypothetical protein